MFIAQSIMCWWPSHPLLPHRVQLSLDLQLLLLHNVILSGDLQSSPHLKVLLSR